MRFNSFVLVAAVYGLLAAFRTANATQDNSPYSVVTYSDENCQGRVLAFTAIDNQCKNLPMKSNLYVNGLADLTSMVSINYDCRSGLLMSFSDADCVTFSGSTIGVLAQNSCMKANGASYRVVCNGYALSAKIWNDTQELRSSVSK